MSHNEILLIDSKYRNRNKHENPYSFSIESRNRTFFDKPIGEKDELNHQRRPKNVDPFTGFPIFFEAIKQGQFLLHWTQWIT